MVASKKLCEVYHWVKVMGGGWKKKMREEGLKLLTRKPINTREWSEEALSLLFNFKTES